jgi:predicted GIY-YIG superfamily endonuclease
VYLNYINMDRTAYLYKIENILNRKCYIGVSIDPVGRFATHKSIAKTGKNAHHIHHAMRYHINDIDDVFKLIIMEIFPSEELAYQEEIKVITEYREKNIAIYNEAPGGEHGPVMFGEDNPFYGKHHSNETKSAISKANKGKFVGENNFFYGKKFLGPEHPLYRTKRPQNVLDALSKAHKGKIISEELKKQWSKSHKGKLTGDKNPMFGKTGETNPNAGISDEKAIEIYKMYHQDKKMVKEIIQETSISKSTIDRVIYSKGRFVWTKNIK